MDEIYPVAFPGDERPEFTDGFYFLYPPFAIWATIPLASLSLLSAYLVCVAAVAGLTLLAVVVVLMALPAIASKRLWVGMGVAASAPWNAAVILGHLGACLVLSPALALLAWARGHPAWSGVALSFLLAKPNWGIPVLLFLLLGRQWRMLGGFLLGSLGLGLASLPFGIGAWGDWIQTMISYRSLITDATPAWRQVTLFASLQSLLDRPGSDPLVAALWILSSISFWVAALLAWARWGHSSGRFPRLLGVAFLTILVTNPYAYYYDALLALPAAAVLWTQPQGYGGRRLRHLILGVFSATYVWTHVQFFIGMERAPSLAGIGLGMWLGLELMDLLMAGEGPAPLSPLST